MLSSSVETAPLPYLRTQSEWWWSSYKWRRLHCGSTFHAVRLGALKAPQCSVTREDLHPAWFTLRKKFSGMHVCAQAQAPLTNTHDSLRKPAHHTSGQMKPNGWCSVEWPIWGMTIEKEREAKKNKANWSSKYWIFCCSHRKSCNIPFHVFDSDWWHIATLETEILLNTVLATCCSQCISFLCTVVALLT